MTKLLTTLLIALSTTLFAKDHAGSIIDQLEAARIVGPFEGSKERKVLIQSNDELLKEWITNEHLIKEDSKEFQEALQKARREQNK